MKKIYLLFIFIFVFSFFSQVIFANDKNTEKACMDDREIAEEHGFDCKNIGNSNSNNGVSALQKIIDLRNKNKGGAKSTATTTSGNNSGNSASTASSVSNSCSYTNCIHYNYDNFQIGKWGGAKYSIRDGNKVVASNGNLAVMEKVDDFIRHYGVSSVCYVGDEFNRFMSIWYKTGSNGKQILPAGSMRGEDCISFNASSAEVKKLKGDWKIVDGRNWLISFGGAEREAHDALCLIKKYNLSKTCFAGGRTILQYMRK